MQNSVLQDISRPQWYDIMRHLKQSQGLVVGELCEKLDMSYMGVKQHCVALEKLGYLDTWRRPKKVGRPEKVYRLTAKANPVFSESGSELSLGLLEAVSNVYGPSAPDKLLFNYFQKKKEEYARKIKGDSVAERATALAKVRDSEGFLSECIYSRGDGLQICEYHHPYWRIIEAYPSVKRMEESNFSDLLGSNVRREEESVSGLSKIIFHIDSLGS